MDGVNNMLPSQVTSLLEQLTSLQQKDYNDFQLAYYREGYYKIWLSHLISQDAGQIEILKELIETAKERNNVI
jgi:hypothetical protein